MSSTTKRMWRMPGALAGAGPASPSYEGERYLASSTLPLPSGVRSITISALTPSSPFMRSTESPSTDASPSHSSPSAAKNAVAAARSSTTIPMCSRRWTVMNGPRPVPAAWTRRASDTSASWSPGVVGRAARGPSPDERSRSTLLDIGTLIQLPGGPVAGSPSGMIAQATGWDAHPGCFGKRPGMRNVGGAARGGPGSGLVKAAGRPHQLGPAPAPRLLSQLRMLTPAGVTSPSS